MSEIDYMMKVTRYFFVIFFILVFKIDFREAVSLLPSVIWDPSHPLFGCEEPTINVKIGYSINMQCPMNTLTTYLTSSDESTFNGNVYFLGNDTKKYKSVNVTNSQILLTCNGKNTYTQLNFSEHGSLQTFKRGKTYYAVGVSKTSSKETKTTRLRFNVCDDRNDANCGICKSEACYYSKCYWKCGSWVDAAYYKADTCKALKARKCVNKMLGEDKYENMYTNEECAVERHASGMMTGLVTIIVILLLLSIFLAISYRRVYTRRIHEHPDNRPTPFSHSSDGHHDQEVEQDL